MRTVEIVFGGIFLFYAGGAIGYWLAHWLRSKSDFDGVIHITQEEDKILYSLDLHESPDMLLFMDEVIFKVDNSVESFIRD